MPAHWRLISADTGPPPGVEAPAETAPDRARGNITVSVVPDTQRENQSFAETALRLGGKSDEEIRRTGAMDKADEQVEKLFSRQHQTASSPIHRAVWDQAVPVEL